MSYQPSQPDTALFRNTHQVGGIRTGTLDHPDTGGRVGSRVAFFNTGAGLRFTVALDRGADIVEAALNQYNLVHLSPNGYTPPSHAYNQHDDWLRSWPAGLVTTCGPVSLGRPGVAIQGQRGLHGHFSNLAAGVESVVNCDPLRGRYEMSLTAVITESRMMGAHVEIRRTYRCVLGENVIHIHDEVTNLANMPTPHHYLYHCNFGYPLLAPGTRVIAAGKATGYWANPGPGRAAPEAARCNQIKTIAPPTDQHVGGGEHGMILTPTADNDGRCHVGLFNDDLKLAVELTYPAEHLPSLANWQHLGQRGSYVVGVEPYYGTLVAKDPSDWIKTTLEPGQSRSYDLTICVHSGDEAATFAERYDGKITV